MSDETTAPTTPAAPDAPPPEAAAGQEPPAPEPTPEEAAAAAEQSARDERRAARIRDAAAAEERAAERRAQSRAQGELRRLEQERAEFQRQRDAWQRERETEREAVLRGGPDALKARLGLDYSDLTREYLSETDPHMKERIAERRELDAIKRELEETRQWKAQQEQERLSQAAEQGMRLVLKSLDDAGDRYPNAWEMSEAEQRRELARIAGEMRADGETPNVPGLLKRLDVYAKAIQDEREKRRSLRKPPVTTPSDGKPATASSSSAIRGDTRTLTNAAASAKTNGRQLTEEEQDEIFRQQLREAMKKDEARKS